MIWDDVLRVRYERFSVKRTTSVHYSGVIIRAMASQIPSVSIAHSIVCLGTEQRKLPSSASLAFVRGIHRLPLNSLHKGSVRRKRFPFDDVIMAWSSMIMASSHGWLDLFAHRLCTGTAALTARKCGPVSVVHDSGHRGKQRKLFSSNHPGAKLQTAFENSHRFVPPIAFWYRCHTAVHVHQSHTPPCTIL